MEKLQEYDIEAYIVKEWIPFPKIPEDQEVILRHKNDEEINIAIVIDIFEV